MSHPPVGIAVVGAGPWGLTLAGAFERIPQVSLRWICELEDERRARATLAHPNAHITADLNEALQDPSVAAVVVAVDPAGHHAVSLRVLEAGKHLFVEKPLALSARDASQIRQAALAGERVLAVGHVLLHNRTIQQAREIVAQGTLGETLAFESRRTTVGAPRRPGSAWWALAPHDVSLALYLFGALPTAVAAAAGDRGDAQEDHAATAVLHFPGGRTARIQVARFVATKRREVTIAGTRAMLTFDELAVPAEALRLWTPDEGSVVVAGERVDALRAQCLDFIMRVSQGDARADQGTHAVDVVSVLEAGEQSMRREGAAQPICADVRVSIDVGDSAASAGRDRASFEAA
jgi:predicted dehydrogenase